MTGKRKVGRNYSDNFLPEGATKFFGRLARRVGGMAVLTLAVMLAAALISYNPLDPSLNTASESGHVTSNFLGKSGSYLADSIFQTFGLLSWLLPVILMVGGGHIVLLCSLPKRTWLRISQLMAGIVFLDIGISSITLPSFFHLPVWLGGTVASGLGGAIGKIIWSRIYEVSRLIEMIWISWLLAFICILLGGFCLFVMTGISRMDWLKILAYCKHSLATIQRFIGNSGSRIKFLRPGEKVPDKANYQRIEPGFGPSFLDESERDEPVERPKSSTNKPVEQRGKTLVEPRSDQNQKAQRGTEAIQEKLDLGNDRSGWFDLPSLTLLSSPPDNQSATVDHDALTQNARLLESVLDDFGVNGKIVKVRPGPVVTLYELEPSPGTKTSRVIGLADDIARSMSALSVRIATVPGRSVIGIELPNQKRETVYLRELLSMDAFEKSSAMLPLVLGKDIGGQPNMIDLTRMPHLLIAGTTGSGKSVAINTMILSLLYRLKPSECRMIMIDPKMLELSVYDGIPHLLAPVVTEPGKAVVALKWAVREMEQRYRSMSQLGVRNIAGYNQRLAEAKAKNEALTRTIQTGFDSESGNPIYEEQPLALDPLPFIVVVIDEMADLMLVAGKDIEAAVQRLAQMARAAGIHLVMATQRPSVDVITGTIKANFPSRISFQVSSKIDSRTILGEQGAEQLLGQGDMLFMAAGGRITRVHGPFVSDQEVESVADHLRRQGEPLYVDAVTEEPEEPGAAAIAGAEGGADGGNELYDQAVALVAREGKASTSFIQRHLQLGYNRAASIIERMEKEGVISHANHVGKRQVLVSHHGD